MKNFNDELDALNFHDSYIHSFSLTEEGILRIQIFYYNWEGNQRSSEEWITKFLTIEVEHVIHLEFSSPGLFQNDQEIYDHESLTKHDLMRSELDNYNKERNIEAENSIAVRFLTHSYGSAVFNHEVGFLEVGGLNAKLIWSDITSTGRPIHIPVGE